MRKVPRFFFTAAVCLFVSGCGAVNADERLDRLEMQMESQQLLDIRLEQAETRLTDVEQAVGELRAVSEPDGSGAKTVRPAARFAPRPVPAPALVTEATSPPSSASVAESAAQAAPANTVPGSSSSLAAGIPPEISSGTPVSGPFGDIPALMEKRDDKDAPASGAAAPSTEPDHLGAALSELDTSRRSNELRPTDMQPLNDADAAHSNAAFAPQGDGESEYHPMPGGKWIAPPANVERPAPQATPTPAPHAASTPAPHAASTPAAKAVPAGSSDEQSAYTAALSLYERNQYDAAGEAFQAFLQRRPNSSLAPNAMYWLGECSYSSGKLDAAIMVFKDAAAKYPKHPKTAASLLKAGYAYARMNDWENAYFYWQILIDDFPNSPPAALAKKRMAESR